MNKEQNDKLDEILALTRAANSKIDRLGERVESLDSRLFELEKRMDKLGIKAVAAGGLGGAITAIGIEIIKASLGQ
ncbi:hypothetical protein [Volucribacter amazonae]|uniref:Hemolysin XhlA n=1 Tax=Volucribacter amazonae TaxID=256731 RepID=A0A9X4PBE7_9PAST|nr:hypothetical protein [Volucribacter amazonae]MDG6895052.1 hypothetical protein [Volucribacter amazonae]